VRWSEVLRHWEYKAAWYGRPLVKSDKWYPSSKRCADCGYVRDSLPLAARQWTCPACGVHHDRDVNAAKHVRAAGLAVNAGGEARRPGRARPASARLNEAGLPTALAVGSGQDGQVQCMAHRPDTAPSRS
jgi:transposase